MMFIALFIFVLSTGAGWFLSGWGQVAAGGSGAASSAVALVAVLFWLGTAACLGLLAWASGRGKSGIAVLFGFLPAVVGVAALFVSFFLRG